MADGDFTTLVSKDKNANAAANPIITQLSNGTAVVGVTAGALDVNVASGSVTVTATDLDIRNLSQTTDHVLVYGNTAKDGSGTDYVPLLDTDGKLIISNPGGTQYVEDAVAAANATGGASLVERDDVLTTITPAEGDWTKLYASSKGALWVAIDGTVTVGGTVAISGTVAVTQSGTWNIATVTTLTGITNTVTVDASDLDIRDLSASQDNVAISDGTDTLAVNTDGSINVNIVTAALSDEYHDYDTASAVAGGASDTHTVTASGGIMTVSSVIASCSGRMKFEIQNNAVTVAVGFIPGGGGGGTQVIPFIPAIEVADAQALTVIRTNRQGQANDVYSTVTGRQL